MAVRRMTASAVPVALALVLASPFSATAAADDEQPAPSMADLAPDGTACFGRVYDQAHLKAHPNQKISRIYFYYGKSPIRAPLEEPPSEAQNFQNGFLATTVRGARKPDWVAASCGRDEEGGPISCGMECDRTLATLTLGKDDRLMLSNLSRDTYLDAGAEEELGKAEYDRQALGADDDGFRLDRKPAAECLTEFARIDPVDPALGAPLRQRLAPDTPFCFGRDYDAAHLSSHPGQMTRSIRVYRGQAELAAFARDGSADNWPNNAEIAVSVTTRRNAAAATQLYTCYGEGDQWRCEAKGEEGSAACDVSYKEIYLRRAVNGGMMLANPNAGVPILDLCSPAAGQPTASDDKLYRLEPMPQSACGG